MVHISDIEARDDDTKDCSLAEWLAHKLAYNKEYSSPEEDARMKALYCADKERYLTEGDNEWNDPSFLDPPVSDLNNPRQPEPRQPHAGPHHPRPLDDGPGAEPLPIPPKPHPNPPLGPRQDFPNDDIIRRHDQPSRYPTYRHDSHAAECLKQQRGFFGLPGRLKELFFERFWQRQRNHRCLPIERVGSHEPRALPIMKSLY